MDSGIRRKKLTSRFIINIDKSDGLEYILILLAKIFFFLKEPTQ